MKIACIHTSNVSYYELKNLFTEAAPEVELMNIVDDSLLEEVKTVGRITPAIISRMCTYFKVAESLGADAVINIRYASSAVMQGAAEVIVYGTAVKFVK